MGNAIVSGVIGAIICLIGTWLLFGMFKLPLVMANVYIGVGFAGFFSSFFAIVFSGKCCNKS
jgi:hypothetical protein